MSDLKSSSSPLSTKIFVGGLSWDTTDVGFTSFFSRFGEIKDSVIMRDKSTGGSRGFGFVKFADAASVDKVLAEELELDGRKIDCKVAVPREAIAETSATAGQRTKKIFVGGLSIKTTQEEFKAHFDQFGPVVNAVIMMDSQSRRSRGFGFITFDSESVVEAVLARTHVLNGKPVELKRAIPKEKMAPATTTPTPTDGYAGYDQRGYSAEFAYPAGYGYAAYPTTYPSYPGYEYPRPEGYREDYYGAGRGSTVAPPAPGAPRGYGYETPAPASTPAWGQQGYPEVAPPASTYGVDYSRYQATPRSGYGATPTYGATGGRDTLAASSRGAGGRGAGYDSTAYGASAAGYGASAAGNGSYAYNASRTPKPDRSYHPYGR